jgi:AraC-like DNA-binding protein
VRLGKIRHVSEAARGVLRPAEIGRAFSLAVGPPPADLAAAIDRHWIVRWDLRGRDPHRSEVLTHPAVHLVLEPHGAFVYGVRRTLDVHLLSGRGYAVGTMFLPGGFAAFTERPIDELTDRVLELEEIFGDDGARLAEAAAALEDPREALAPLHDLLRARRRPVAPAARLVAAAVAQMREAAPGTLVSDIAARQAVSVRTLQRLFARYVGVGPKWVLQRYRLHEALEQLAGRPRPDYSRLAVDLGYFDHAHFIRDFRAVAGRSPAEYERELTGTAA